jgi:TM2 domain-containing membrane protein YozV
MNCANCGKSLTPNARFCPSCGTSTISAEEPKKPGEQRGTRGSPKNNLVPSRSPPLSPHFALLSLVVAGLGQLVLGQVAKGLIALAGLIAFAFIIAPAIGLPAGSVFFIGLVVQIVLVVDGYFVGRALQRGQPVGKLQWFPQ